MPHNLFNKIWEMHTVKTLSSGETQLFIGMHLIHEVTSPQAFQMLRDRSLRVMFPERTFATVDHIVPTKSQARPFQDELAEKSKRRVDGQGQVNGLLHGCFRVTRQTEHKISQHLDTGFPGDPGGLDRLPHRDIFLDGAQNIVIT